MKITIATGTADGFFNRAKAIAGKLDRGERLVPEMRITFEDPFALMRAITARRMEIILTVRKQPSAISELALQLNRQRAAVVRDVQALEAMGLVKTTLEKNPGHGQKRVVRPLAEKYELVAAL